MDLKTVACALPSELVEKLDRRIKGTITSRAAWLRLAILKAAHEEGFVQLTLDSRGNIYSLDMTRAAG